MSRESLLFPGSAAPETVRRFTRSAVWNDESRILDACRFGVWFAMYRLAMDRSKNQGPPVADQAVVLVAEDEVMVRNVVRITLETDGYFVLSADDGEEALQLSRSYPGRIHLLLTDVMMPRMGGLELCGHLRRERPDTEVLVFSGGHHPGTEAAYLAKPFTPADLRAAVRAVLPDAVRLGPSVPKRR
jgi:CheY-like chemotaxis protein